MDPHALAVAVRWLHVAAMALALGGAVLLATLARGSAARDERARTVLAAAASYEWIFWVAVGVLAMTGIGNLASFGAALAAPASAWGATFTAKLVAVIALALFSIPRTLAIAQLAAAPVLGPRAGTVLRSLYGATALGLAAILALAMAMAHG